MPFDLTTAYATDSTLVEEGSKMTLTEDSHCVVARIPNEKYTRRLSTEVERNQKLLDLKTVDSEELSNSIMAKVLAETVLVDWKGVAYKGKTLKYSKENAIKMFKEYPDFRRMIVEYANDINNYRSVSEEDAEKK